MQPTETPSAPYSPVQGLVDVFLAPGRLFTALRDKVSLPGWLLPFLVVSLISMAIQYLMHAYTGRATLGSLPDTANPQMVAAMKERFASPPRFSLLWTPLGVGIITAIGAGILTGLAAMFTGKAKFMPLFAAMMYSGLILLPAQIINYIIVSARGLDAVQNLQDIMWTIGPAMFVPAENKMLFMLLSQVNLFQIWWIAVMVIAMEKITGGKRGGAVAAVLIYWALAAGLQIGMLKLGGMA